MMMMMNSSFGVDFICLALVTGKMLNVRPMKIIAGCSLDKTNKFLQQMALVVSMKVNKTI